MLATLVDEPFSRPGWIFEIKWDGYRAIAEIGKGRATLYSRNHKSFDETYGALLPSLRRIRHRAILDGEVVALDGSGRASFQLLQQYLKTGEGRLVYYVFDLLELDGRDLRGLPLLDRKRRLAKVLPDLPDVRISQHIVGGGEGLFRAAAENGVEGIVAKDGASPYREGRRSGEWLKIKTQLRQEAVICGYTAPRGSRKHFGALILGMYHGRELRYVGHAGTGFGATTLTDLARRMKPLETVECPFASAPKTHAPPTWLSPKLVCEVGFSEWTEDERMRHPVYLGLREDKSARQVHREVAKRPPKSAHAAA